jgi:hypothetical protein
MYVALSYVTEVTVWSCGEEGDLTERDAWMVAMETASVTRHLHLVALAKPVEGETSQKGGNPGEGGTKASNVQ